MARTVRDANLETRAARARLRQRKEPYWRSIDQGCHLGYYKGARGGSWLARQYLEGSYTKTTLGTADDKQDADGVAILNFGQAQATARAWFTEQARRAAGLDPKPAGPYTVANATSDYLVWYAAHRRALAETQSAVDSHILPTLGHIELAKLTPARIREWHHGVAAAPARLRTRKGAKANTRAADDPEARRRRRATANRVLTVLKAALNHAWREGKVSSDEGWRRVRPFPNVDAPIVRYLSEAECVRLVNACPPDFRQLVRGALLTGCRYGELVMLKASDFNADAGTLRVRTSKSGKARHVVLTDEGRAFFAGLTAGRAGDALVFLRADGQPWGKSHQARPLIEACERAKITPAISFHVLRHTHGSTLAMKGVPLAVIAEQLGHADLRMTQRHYAHLAPSYVADTIRANFPRLGILELGNVAALAPKAG